MNGTNNDLVASFTTTLKRCTAVTSRGVVFENELFLGALPQATPTILRSTFLKTDS